MLWLVMRLSTSIGTDTAIFNINIMFIIVYKLTSICHVIRLLLCKVYIHVYACENGQFHHTIVYYVV